MLKYIEKLQKKPESVRWTVLIVLVSMIMIGIMAIWLSTVALRFSKTKKTTDTSSAPSPFSVVKDNATGFYDNIKSNIGDLEKQL